MEESRVIVSVDACEDCGDIAMSIRPRAALSVLVVIFANKNGEASKDPAFKLDFQASKAHREANPLGRAMFKPASTVMNSQTYSYTIFQDVAAVTEQEYTEMTGHSPEKLKFEVDHCKLQTMPIPLFGPGTNVNLYGISLQELPEKYWHCVRKARISFGCGATHEEAFLTPEVQLHENHGHDVFKHVCLLHQQSRPDPLHLKGSASSVSGRVPTLAQLRERHAELEEQIKKSLEEEQNPLLEAYNATHDTSSSSRPKTLGLGGGSLTKESQQARDKQAAAARQNLKKRGKAVAAATDGAATASASAASGAPQLKLEEVRAPPEEEDDTRTSRKGSLNKRDTEMERIKATLDESLLEVAEAHLSAGGTSLKSFEGLTAENFLSYTMSDKSCSSGLLGVQGSVLDLPR